MLLGGCGADRSAAPADDAVFGVVLDQCGALSDARASAVAVGTHAVVTVAHSFDDVRAVELVDRHGQVWPARVVLIDSSVDLAVLTLDDAHPAPLSLVDAAAGTGGRVLSFADPAGVRDEPTEIRRRVRATLEGQDPRQALELGAALGRGDSGAPVLDGDDGVVGIVFASSRRGERGWAVDAAEVRRVLARVGAGSATVELGCG